MIALMLEGYAILVIMMATVWLIYRRIDNAAIVDVGWGGGFAILGLVFFLLGQGLPERRVLISVLMVLWGGRLAWHLLKDRILSGRPEDGRYQDFRAKWRDRIDLKFFLFFQAQAALVILFSTPMALLSSATAPPVTPVEWIGVAVWLVGFSGEAAADSQLKRFKDDPVNRGRTCQSGLWKYSRHPNYFFEWVIWVSYSLMALAVPYGWIGILAPLGMLYILLRITGVSLTEEHALRTRGAEYREYQGTTSPFVPLPRRAPRKVVAR